MANRWQLEQARPDFNWNQFHRYSGLDSANTLEICLAQIPLLKQRRVESTFQSEMSLCYPLISIELKGMLIDSKVRTKIFTELQAQIDKWQLFLTTLCGDLNVQSPDQLKHYFYTQLRLPKRTKDGKLSTDEDAMLSLMHLQPVLIKAILILKALKKQQTFTKSKLAEDGRARTTFKPAGTLTGRLSSSKSITGTGTNLQTIPKAIREFFICDPGYILIQVDYAKAESWIVAYLAKDEKMIEALQGPDFHSTNASAILGKPVTKADYDDRQLGKKISHGCNYNMTEFQMQLDLAKEGYSFTKTECKGFKDHYFVVYPKIKKNFHGEVEECLKTTRTLITPFGRKITFWDFWSTRLLNQAYAYRPQSTVGDLTNTALINVYNDIPELDLLLQVHDSLVMQCKIEDYTPELIEKIEKAMAVPVTVKGVTITIPIDLEVGWNWYKLVEPPVMDKVLQRMDHSKLSTLSTEDYLDYRKEVFAEVMSEIKKAKELKTSVV